MQFVIGLGAVLIASVLLYLLAAILAAVLLYILAFIAGYGAVFSDGVPLVWRWIVLPSIVFGVLIGFRAVDRRRRSPSRNALWNALSGVLFVFLAGTAGRILGPKQTLQDGVSLNWPGIFVAAAGYAILLMPVAFPAMLGVSNVVHNLTKRATLKNSLSRNPIS